jgi:hypothetical protein
MIAYKSDMGYASACSRGWRGRVWSALTGRSRCLLSLADVSATCAILARRSVGIRTVPIDQIRGTDSRSRDFDRDFNPLQTHTAHRWHSVASARQEGKELPPVELVQIGDVYFVRDGHHRISVARALGQQSIEAEVVAWEVSGPLPWEDGVEVAGWRDRARETGARAGKVQAAGGWLRRRLLPL